MGGYYWSFWGGIITVNLTQWKIQFVSFPYFKERTPANAEIEGSAFASTLLSEEFKGAFT
jgi:hypothetical protein